MKTKVFILLVLVFMARTSFACVTSEDQVNQNTADYNAKVDQINQDNAASSAAGAQVAQDKKLIDDNQTELDSLQAILDGIAGLRQSYSSTDPLFLSEVNQEYLKGTSYYVDPSNPGTAPLGQKLSLSDAVQENLPNFNTYINNQIASLKTVISNFQMDEIIQSAKEPDTSEQLDQVPLPDTTVCATPTPVIAPPVVVPPPTDASNTTDAVAAPVIKPTPDTTIYPYQQKIIDSVKVPVTDAVNSTSQDNSYITPPVISVTNIQTSQDATPTKPSWIENIFLIIKSWF